MGGANRREAWLVLLAALALFAWPLRGALFGGRVLAGVDTATAQLPWSAVLRPEQAVPRNPALSDQGMVFYPATRWVLESWARGDPPLWNPLLYAGAPALGNPQLGVIDPQVLAFLPLELLGGRELADRGFGLAAWGRLAMAALGTWLLARRLGLARSGAALAALSLAGSGASLLWVGASVGHVGWLLPWILWALERMCAPGWRAGWLLCALLLALAILGGHPETAFYVGAAAGVWGLSLWREKRAFHALAALLTGVLLTSPLLGSFLDYLGASGALVARRGVPRPALDLWALGLLLVAVGGWLRWHSQRAEPLACRDKGAPPGPLRTAGSAALAAGLVFVLVLALGLPDGARLALAWDLRGIPGSTHAPWRGEGAWIESASPWLPLLTLGLAFAGLLTTPSDLHLASSRLRRRGVVLSLGLVALLLALQTPGLIELYRRAPLVGLGATARASWVAALMLALLAGEALDSAPRRARLAGALLLGALALLASRVEPAPMGALELLEPDPPDELVVFTQLPDAGAKELRIAGWIDARVGATAALVRIERALPDGSVEPRLEGGLPAALAPAGAGAPPGALAFRSPALDPSHLAAGDWRCVLELRGAAGRRIGERVAAVLRVERPVRWRPFALLALAAALALTAGLPSMPRGAALALAMVAVGAQVLDLARTALVSVPREECFPPTRTEALLAELLAEGGRYLADPGILPPDTGMVRGLRALDGYDALDPAAFDAFRPLALRPGVHPLAGFTASGADLDSPAFRLLGVRALLTHAPLAHPGWELVAGPESAPQWAEVCIQRPRDPLPLAYCVPRVRRLAADGTPPADFDPAMEALLDHDNPLALIERPFTHARVLVVERSNNRLVLDVELDGDGVLVLSEQAFAGWRVEEKMALLNVNGIFRGVPLWAGRHMVTLSYLPPHLEERLALAALGCLVLLGVAAGGRRRKPDPAPASGA